MNKPAENQGIEKARLGYQTAMQLVGLESQQIYSRFNAMLTANSIIIAIIGWTLKSNDITSCLPLFLAIGGLILCAIWIIFIRHGVYWQDIWRKEAEKLENRYFADTFQLISRVTTESPAQSTGRNLEKPKFIRWFNFYRTSIVVIIVFALIYVAMFGIALNQITCGVPDNSSNNIK